MIKTNNLTKYYGDVLGVKNVTLEIKEGEIFGLLGPNGAGKSTFINCIMKLINKTSGEIFIDGKLIVGENYKKDIGYLPSEVHLYEDMKVSDMFAYSASFYGENLTKRIKYLVSKLKVPMNKKIEDLSFGNLKKVGIVLTLMHNPKILILDEPTSGLDPLIKEEFFKLLREEKEKGVTILFSTHVLSEVKEVCDRIGMIKNGELVTTMNVQDVVDNSFNVITIKGSNYKKLKLPIKDIKIKEEGNDFIKFIYTGDINDLIKVISEVNIDGLIVEEPNVEDIFMTYYR